MEVKRNGVRTTRSCPRPTTDNHLLTRLVGAGAQQLDHVGVVHLLEEAVLGDEVMQLVRRVVGLQHLHRHPATVCVDVDKQCINLNFYQESQASIFMK